MAADRTGMFLRSGWPPAASVLALVTALELSSGTAVRDLAAFGIYGLVCLVVPGTLLWRMLRPVASRLWLADVVFGTIVAYAIEIAFYLPARWAGYPLLVLVWPAAVYAIAIVTRLGRQAWRPGGLAGLPTWWSWSLAGITSYLVLFVARANWWETGVSGERLRAIGPDASFQLALTGELRHHVPPSIPWVAGEPLHYHWLTYVHTAAATWITSIEPIVMLRRLAPLFMAVLIVLAVALIAHHMSGRAPLGPLAAGLLVVVHSPAFYAAETDHFQRQEFTSAAIFGSPTMTFGTMLFTAALYLLMEILRSRSKPTSWLVFLMLAAATAGAKATFSPMLVAGTLTVLVVGLLTRSASRSQLGLFACTLAVWLAFQFGFYGGDSTGARLTTRGTLDFAAPTFGAVTPAPWTWGGVALIVVTLLLWGARMAGMLGLLPEGGWRDPVTLFLWGFVLSGLGASALLELSAASQQWFVNSTQAAVAVGAALGLGRLWSREAGGQAARFTVAAAVVGIAGMAVGWVSTPTSPPAPGPVLPRLWSYAAPFLITVLVLAAVGLIVAARRRTSPMSSGLLFVCVGLTGLGLFRTVQLAVALAQVPWTPAAMPPAADVPVGAGGVDAARWIREVSSPEDLLATNAHTLTPTDGLQLSFRLAGYSERRVLVESWGYTPRHSRAVVEEGLGFDEVPFWDPQRLEANDRAFTTPSEGKLRRLREELGVSWLVLDRRFPADEEALSSLLPPVYSRGEYAVYDLEDLS